MSRSLLYIFFPTSFRMKATPVRACQGHVVVRQDIIRLEQSITDLVQGSAEFPSAGQIKMWVSQALTGPDVRGDGCSRGCAGGDVGCD